MRWQQLRALVMPWRWLLAAVVLGVLLSAGLEVVPPLLIRQVVDDHITTGQQQGVLALAFLYLGVTAAIQGLTFLTTYCTAIAAQGALHTLRVRVFAHLQRLPMPYHDQTPLGDSISRCTADVDTIDSLFSSGVLNVVTDLVRLLTILIAMFALSWPLTLVTLVVILPVAGVTRLFQLRVRAAERASRLAVGEVNTRLQELLGGVEVIRAFAAEFGCVRAFRTALSQMLVAYNRAMVYSALYSPSMAILAALASAVLLWYGTRQTFTAWGISLGTLTAFVLLVQQFFKPITNLGDEWQTVQSALAGAERLFAILELEPEPTPAPAPRTALPREATALALDHVVFGYHPGLPVLRDVSLCVQRGEHLALVGRTGAGKSTVLHLLGGFYAPWRGSVRVQQRDPRLLSTTERRQVCGVVPQVVHVFGKTVWDNLTLGDPQVTEMAVHRAAQLAGAADFVTALPEGYQTRLRGSGHGVGIQLSAGQCQLLALARALVWAPPILILDEATSAVDSVSEATLRAALRSLMATHGLAVLSVAHRLATACTADRVVVLDAGQVVETGTPDALTQADGRFAAWLVLEAAGWPLPSPVGVPSP